MTRPMFAYTKKILESVSFDPKLFCKELEKAIIAWWNWSTERLVGKLYKGEAWIEKLFTLCESKKLYTPKPSLNGTIPAINTDAVIV